MTADAILSPGLTRTVNIPLKSSTPCVRHTSSINCFCLGDLRGETVCIRSQRKVSPKSVRVKTESRSLANKSMTSPSGYRYGVRIRIWPSRLEQLKSSPTLWTISSQSELITDPIAWGQESLALRYVLYEPQRKTDSRPQRDHRAHT